ncbi:hypothetical protein DOT_4700 [Desulfosporosinus sp. OT]|nr:hypothetical protein DOT_4700 [Desulfosporosinus sp. OT]
MDKNGEFGFSELYIVTIIGSKLDLPNKQISVIKFKQQR